MFIVVLNSQADVEHSAVSSLSVQEGVEHTAVSSLSCSGHWHAYNFCSYFYYIVLVRFQNYYDVKVQL